MPVLVVSPHASTQAFLHEALSRLNLPHLGVHTVRDCRDITRARHYSVAVSEYELPDGDWNDVLDALGGSSCTNLLVTARTADDRLWADVLHRGGYDVLVQPFDPLEVQRVLTVAWDQQQSRGIRRETKPLLRMAAAHHA